MEQWLSYARSSDCKLGRNWPSRLCIELLNDNRVVMSFLNQKLDEDNALWTFIKESERESFNTRLAYNEKGGWNEPIQNYDDKVNECKDSLEPSER